MTTFKLYKRRITMTEEELFKIWQDNTCLSYEEFLVWLENSTEDNHTPIEGDESES